MSILADTNVLLRRTQPDHPSHTLAVESVARLLAAGEPVYFTLQNISGFNALRHRGDSSFIVVILNREGRADSQSATD
jgi:hypothetical protein